MSGSIKFNMINDDTLIGQNMIMGKPAIVFDFDPDKKKSSGIGIVMCDIRDAQRIRAIADRAIEFFEEQLNITKEK